MDAYVLVLAIAILAVGVLALLVLRRMKQRMDPTEPEER